ncbi:coiled-coil domain-containing protein 15 isoform X2 [Ranitomeya variabilis]|uniref:coiled-coil domain-containing protein 15 isoform X2 n=1 Tax=Ranitomeya variabilis TaxID=490064 RepID=UPI0040576E7D
MSVRTEMAPPVQRPVRRKEEPERGLPRPSRMVVNQAVLAERNPGRVAAVGAWIEPGDRGAADRVRVPAQQIEDQLIQYQREKEQRLIRFQGEVKRRVNQHAKQCKQHQLQKSYDVITREGIIVTQSSDAAMHFTPKRNTCTYRNTEVAICSPHKRWVSAQRISDDSEDDLKEWDGNKLFLEHAKALKNTMRQVRGRLAALKTVEAEELTLPGGLWKVSPTRDNPVSRRSPVLCSSIAEEDEISLRGYHDLPVELLPHESQRHLLEKENAIPSVKSVCNRLMKESYRAGPAPAYNTDYRAALVLRPGVDEEEERKQRQSQYLMYRRLFMDIEREQVKETRRQKEHERKISKMKHEREVERLMEEQRLRVSAFPHIQRRSSESEETKQEATAEVERERVQKSKDCNRYIEALRAQMKDKLLFHNIELPPLCCCGSDFWDSHPDTCANNCVFYKNPKAYSRALQSVLLSRDMWDGSAGSRFSACNISFAEPRGVR